MIIKTTEEARKYLAVNAAFTFGSISPSIKRAEREYLIDVMGKELLGVLDTAYNAEDGLTDRLTALLPYAQAAAVNLGFMLYIPIGNIQISEKGIQVVTEENRKPAPLWAKEELQNTLKDSGFADLEALQMFLDENQNNYPEWVDSSAFDRVKELFVNTASAFSQIYPIGNSWRTFVRLKPIMRNVEEDLFVSALGEEYFNELKEKFRDEDANSDDKKVLAKLNKAIVFYTVAEACRLLPVELSENGLSIKSYMGNGINKQEQAAPSSLISNLTDVTSKKAQEYLEQMKSFMNSVASPSVLPTYYNSDAYTKPEDYTGPGNINTSGSGIYFPST